MELEFGDKLLTSILLSLKISVKVVKSHLTGKNKPKIVADL